jgi:hypothetical protein
MNVRRAFSYEVPKLMTDPIVFVKSLRVYNDKTQQAASISTIFTLLFDGSGKLFGGNSERAIKYLDKVKMSILEQKVYPSSSVENVFDEIKIFVTSRASISTKRDSDELVNLRLLGVFLHMMSITGQKSHHIPSIEVNLDSWMKVSSSYNLMDGPPLITHGGVQVYISNAPNLSIGRKSGYSEDLTNFGFPGYHLYVLTAVVHVGVSLFESRIQSVLTYIIYHIARYMSGRGGPSIYLASDLSDLTPLGFYPESLIPALFKMLKIFSNDSIIGGRMDLVKQGLKVAGVYDTFLSSLEDEAINIGFLYRAVMEVMPP